MKLKNKTLNDNNHIVLRKFIDPEKAKSLGEEYNKLVEKNNIPGDPQCPTSRALYNHIPFVELLVEKTGEISEIMGESVLPTYTYSRQYLEGSVLKGHRDRPECEVSLTVNLCGDEWPIWINGPLGDTYYVTLEPGDAMLYLGIKGLHGRDEFQGKSCTQLFMHYVRVNGPYNKFIFDKNTSDRNNDNPDENNILRLDSSWSVDKDRQECWIMRFDDMLNKTRFSELEGILRGNAGWGFGFRSDKQTTPLPAENTIEDNYPFWKFPLENYEFFTDFFFKQIEKVSRKKFEILEVYCNGQTYGQDGYPHVDDVWGETHTFLYYANADWDLTHGGPTIFLNQRNIEKIEVDPFPNTGILFTTNIMHYGEAYNQFNRDLRMVVCYKLKEIKE